MKKILIYSIISLLVGGFLSCESDLDAQPEDKIPQAHFWKYKTNVNAYVANLYAKSFPTAYEGSPIFEEAMSDNAFMFWEGWYTNIKLVANGTQNSYGTVPNNIWTSSYSSIRACWQFMENMETIQETFSPEEVTVLTAQVNFFLAYNYHRLIFFFGDVPFVQKVLTVPESMEVPRSSKTEVLQFVLDRLDAASTALEGKKLDRGRVTSGACQTLKARVYLLENDYAKLLTVTTGLIGKYSLHTAGATPYADLFNGQAETANEIILSRIMAHTTGGINTGHSFNQSFLLKGMSGGDAFGAALTPTGSLIDSYPMLDGRLIHEAGSTYNSSDPYKNRDPRLAQSIVYPTSMIRVLSSGVVSEKLYDPENSSTISEHQYNAKEPSLMGYMWRKYVDWSDHALERILDCGNDIIIFRYADVLLMHAEALVETKGLGAKTEVIGIINQLRDRVQGGHVHEENYTNLETLRDLLRNERRIELANEGIRYYDIIRWKIAEKTTTVDGYGLKGELYGAFMRKDGVGSNDRTILVDGAPRRYVELRRFDPAKHYLQPIPQGDIDLAKPGMLTQNPNW